MATKVNLTIEQVRDLITIKLSSINRAMKGAQPKYKLLYEQDLHDYQQAANTLQEVK